QATNAAWAGGAPGHLARDARVLLRPTAPHGPWVGPIQAGIGGVELIFLASAVDLDHERRRARRQLIHTVARVENNRALDAELREDGGQLRGAGWGRRTPRLVLRPGRGGKRSEKAERRRPAE